jgi:hypothetical protein
MELISVEGLQNKEILAKVRLNSEPEKIYLFDFLNKKKISETDITRIYRKAAKLGLSFHIAFKGDFSKKIKEKIEAFKNLANYWIL